MTWRTARHKIDRTNGAYLIPPAHLPDGLIEARASFNLSLEFFSGRHAHNVPYALNGQTADMNAWSVARLFAAKNR